MDYRFGINSLSQFTLTCSIFRVSDFQMEEKIKNRVRDTCLASSLVMEKIGSKDTRL
jgi:hypothetical protein